ncbi:MAG TPA: hypothetical protein VMV86_03015 [Methanosarcinales archaeon]|nr:hypothetical protein [Methanosarcinales archaeon]
MSFIIIKSSQDLDNYINNVKNVYGIRREAFIRNTTLLENRHKVCGYPLLAKVLTSIDHRRNFHTVSVICSRHTAKRLVYWRTSKNSLPGNQNSFEFYIVRDKNSLLKYLNQTTDNFYNAIDKLAKRTEGYEIVVDLRSFDKARSEAMAMMEIELDPFMITSVKLGLKDNNDENKLKFFLTHPIVRLADAKNLVYWKKELSKKTKNPFDFLHHAPTPMYVNRPFSMGFTVEGRDRVERADRYIELEVDLCSR